MNDSKELNDELKGKASRDILVRLVRKFPGLINDENVSGADLVSWLSETLGESIKNDGGLIAELTKIANAPKKFQLVINPSGSLNITVEAANEEKAQEILSKLESDIYEAFCRAFDRVTDGNRSIYDSDFSVDLGDTEVTREEV